MVALHPNQVGGVVIAVRVVVKFDDRTMWQVQRAMGAFNLQGAREVYLVSLKSDFAATVHARIDRLLDGRGVVGPTVACNGWRKWWCVCAQSYGYPGKRSTFGPIALNAEDVLSDVHCQPVPPKDAGVLRRQSQR